MPVGLYFCFSDLTDAKLFIICYGVSAIYFAVLTAIRILILQGVMVRLMLVLAPIACVLGAIAISTTLETYLSPNKPNKTISPELSAVVVAFIGYMLFSYTIHCTFVGVTLLLLILVDNFRSLQFTVNCAAGWFW